MSYFFGLIGDGRTNTKLTRAEIAQRERVAKRHGATFVWVKMPGEQYPRGWFAGPNRGAPFDDNLRKAVLSELAL